MSATPTTETASLFSDRDALRRLAEEVDAKAGIGSDPTITPEKVQALMRAEGIRAEDNLFSRDIIRARYPDEDPDEIAALAGEV